MTRRAPTRRWNTSLRRLRRRCEARMRDLPLPDPFDVRELCDVIAQRRGRPIQLMPMRCGDAGAHGLWIATESADLIVYEEATTPPHQDHIILHEVSHVLCDHYSAKVPAEEYMRLLMPDLDPALVRRFLRRTVYRAVEEQEAELLASLIWEKAERSAEPERETNVLADGMRKAFGWPGRGHE